MRRRGEETRLQDIQENVLIVKACRREIQTPPPGFETQEDQALEFASDEEPVTPEKVPGDTVKGVGKRGVELIYRTFCGEYLLFPIHFHTHHLSVSQRMLYDMIDQ